jgi:hypothetical protein
MTFEVTEKPGKEWDRFVAQQTDIIFYYSVWSDVLKEGLGGRLCYFVLRDGKEIVAGMPGVMLTYGGIRLCYSSIPYGGYIGDPALFAPFMDRVIAETKRADVVYLSPFAADRDTDYAPLFPGAAEAVTRLDLKECGGTGGVVAFGPSVRQSINKAAREGVDIHRCTDRESFLIASRLYLQTMLRNRAIARYSEKWFGALQQILGGAGLAFVYLARHRGVPVSATVVIGSGTGYHLLHSGSSTDHLGLRANDVIVCEIIRDAIREGKEFVDLMHSDPQDTRLVRWKEKFGGRTVHLTKYVRINSPVKHALWNGAKRIYPLLHRFRKTG